MAIGGGEVSWRVEAVRNDLWMRNREAPVKVDKEGLERGTFQHPGFYGLPAERGLNHDSARVPAPPQRRP